jgi:Holin of 3TMs, for gene-transfer release
MGLDLSGFGSVADLFKDGIDKIWPDPAQKAAAQVALLQAQQAGLFKQMDADLQVALEQIKANAVEAAQPGFHFRDAAGWVCVASFVTLVLKPLIEWGCALAHYPVTLPAVDTSTTVPMLFGLLGIGGMHLYQQTKQ